MYNDGRVRRISCTFDTTCYYYNEPLLQTLVTSQITLLINKTSWLIWLLRWLLLKSTNLSSMIICDLIDIGVTLKMINVEVNKLTIHDNLLLIHIVNTDNRWILFALFYLDFSLSYMISCVMMRSKLLWLIIWSHAWFSSDF